MDTAAKKSPTCGKGKKVDINEVGQGKKRKKKMGSAQTKKSSKVQVTGGTGAGKGVKRGGKTGKSAVEVSSSPESPSASSGSSSGTAPETSKPEGNKQLPEKYAVLVRVLWPCPPLYSVYLITGV